MREEYSQIDREKDRGRGRGRKRGEWRERKTEEGGMEEERGREKVSMR